MRASQPVPPSTVELAAPASQARTQNLTLDGGCPDPIEPTTAALDGTLPQGCDNGPQSPSVASSIQAMSAAARGKPIVVTSSSAVW